MTSPALRRWAIARPAVAIDTSLSAAICWADGSCGRSQLAGRLSLRVIVGYLEVERLLPGYCRIGVSLVPAAGVAHP